MDETATDLPRAVALAWGVAANPQRGPKRELSIERIVEVAVGLADAGRTGRGLDGGDRRRARRHLDGALPLRDQQRRPARAHAGGRASASRPRSVREAGADGWRAGLEAWSAAMSEIYREHSWLLDVPDRGHPDHPEQPRLARRRHSRCSRRCRSTGDQKTSGGARPDRADALGEPHRPRLPAGLAADAAPRRTRHRGPSRCCARWSAPTTCPHVRAALDAGVFSPETAGDPFAFGRGLVLDGMAALVEGRATVPPRRRTRPVRRGRRARPEGAKRRSRHAARPRSSCARRASANARSSANARERARKQER